MEWLACRVNTGKEYELRAKIKLIAPDADIFIPRMNYKEIVYGKLKEKSEKILPGYILIGSETPINTVNLKEFIKVIGKVTEEEIARLKSQEGLKEAIPEVGQRVLVIDGPFQGCKGTIMGQKENGSLDCRFLFQGLELKADLKPELVSVIK